MGICERILGRIKGFTYSRLHKRAPSSSEGFLSMSEENQLQVRGEWELLREYWLGERDMQREFIRQTASVNFARGVRKHMISLKALREKARDSDVNAASPLGEICLC